MWYVCFIKSLTKPNVIYVGHTRDINERLKRHNEKRERYTKKFVPFKLIYQERFSTKGEALKRECYFKTPAGRAKKRVIVKRLSQIKGV